MEHYRIIAGSMAPKLPTPPIEWENLILAACLYLLLPLFPVLIEWGRAGTIAPSSLTLTAAMFSITIGISSRSRALFGLTILSSLFFAVQHGFTIGSPVGVPGGASPAVPPVDASQLAGWAILLILVMHLVERYHRHVIDKERVFAFMGN